MNEEVAGAIILAYLYKYGDFSILKLPLDQAVAVVTERLARENVPDYVNG